MARTEQIRSLTSSIWATMLGLPLEDAAMFACDEDSLSDDALVQFHDHTNQATQVTP